MTDSTITGPEATEEEAWEYSEEELVEGGGGEEIEAKAPEFVAADVYEAPIPLDREIFGSRGLHVDMTNMSMQEWARLGGSVYKMEDASPFWLGDWWNLGEDKWSEEAYQVFDVSELFAYKTVVNKAAVCAAIPEEDRVEELTYSHHREAASLKTVAARRKALKWALAGKNVKGAVEAHGEKWTTRQMTDYVKSVLSKDKEPSDKEKGETNSITWSFGYNLYPDDEVGGGEVAAEVMEFIEKVFADRGIEPKSLHAPNKTYNES